MPDPNCPLCTDDGGQVLFRGDGLRVVLADEPLHPGFLRVIPDDHVREMSDLAPRAATRLLTAVLAVERAVRSVVQPDKVNLASLGNVVPHLHWHVIPRFEDDPHFPDPVWSAPRREPPSRAIDDLEARLRAALARELDA